MSLPPNALGDQGQRYMVETFNWPEENQWRPFGYAATSAGALDMMNTIIKHPCVNSARLTDRKPER